MSNRKRSLLSFDSERTLDPILHYRLSMNETRRRGPVTNLLAYLLFKNSPKLEMEEPNAAAQLEGMLKMTMNR